MSEQNDEEVVKTRVELLEEKLKEDYWLCQIVESLFKTNYQNNSTILLVGGAVIDIIENRTPKDYDFVAGNPQIVQQLLDLNEDFKFICESRTAYTFEFRGKKVIQILKRTTVDDFDFTISQASYNIKTGKIDKFDWNSFNSKALRPTSYTADTNQLLALRRIPHWIAKGYHCPEITYQGLLSQLVKDCEKPVNS